VSDFVGAVGLTMPSGFSLAASARFDKDDFRTERTDVRAGYANSRLSLSGTYSEIKAPRPFKAPDEDRREVTGLASLKLHDFWRVAASASYDLVDREFNRHAIGLLYEDECFAFSLAYEDIRDDNSTSGRDWKVGARLSFRTLGNIDAGGNFSPLLTPSF
jgi:LPS-assembly protein